MAPSIGISTSSAPTAASDRPSVGLRLVAGVGGGHDDAAHALRAERVGGDHGDERRVDPARDRDQHALEAVLAHVVAQAELQRLVDLRRGLQRLGELRLELAARRRAPRAGRAGGRLPRPAAPRLAARPLARGPAAGRGRARGRRARAPRRTGPREPASGPAPRRPRCARRRPARPGRPPGCRPRTPLPSRGPGPAPSAPDRPPGRGGTARPRD